MKNCVRIKMDNSVGILKKKCILFSRVYIVKFFRFFCVIMRDKYLFLQETSYSLPNSFVNITVNIILGVR